MKLKSLMVGLVVVLFVTMLLREAYYFASNMYLKHKFTMLSSLDEKGLGLQS